MANGARWLLGRSHELPINLALLARYLWNVQIWRKALVVLVRTGGLGDLVCPPGRLGLDPARCGAVRVCRASLIR